MDYVDEVDRMDRVDRVDRVDKADGVDKVDGVDKADGGQRKSFCSIPCPLRPPRPLCFPVSLVPFVPFVPFVPLVPIPKKEKRPPSLAGALHRVYERTRTGARVEPNLRGRRHCRPTPGNLFPHRLLGLFQTRRTIGMTDFLRAINRPMLPCILDLDPMTYATLNRHGRTSLSQYSIVEYYRQMRKKN